MSETHSNGGFQTRTEPETQGESSQEQESFSSEPKTPQENSGPLTEAQKAQAVAELLSGEAGSGEHENATRGEGEGAGEGDLPGDPALDPSGEGEGQGEAEKPLTLSEAAEKLGLTPEQLYSLELNTGDGETVTLSELKDGHQERAKASREVAEKASELDRREAGIIADQQIWGMLAQSGAVPKPVMAKAAEALKQVVQRESGMLFHLVPEFKDAAKFDHFRRGMVEALGEVGYKPHEVALTDHRQALFVRRYMQQGAELKRVKAELAELRKASNPAPRSGSPQGRGRKSASAGLKNARHGSEAQKAQAVARLLSKG